MNKLGLGAFAALAVTALFALGASRKTAWEGVSGSVSSCGEKVEAIGTLALRHRYAQRLDADGRLKPDAYMTAVRQRESLMRVQPEDPASPTWTYLGPDNVGGRVRAVVFHPTNANTIWIGSVGGGIWKTTNGGSSWSSQNEFLPSLCIGCLVIDKNDGNVLYAGSGESYFDTQYGENNKAAIQGAGIYKTTDGGTTWLQIASTANTDFNCVSRISMSPTNSLILLASTNTGIFRTTDGGANWTKVYNGQVMDVDFSPTDGNRAVAGISALPGVIRSNDAGQTWQNSTGITATVRCETVWSKSVPANVYCGVANGGFVKIWKSTDFGATWILKSTGTGPSCYDAYNDAIWVDPTNDNNLIVGGVNLYRSTNQGANITAAFGNVHSDHHAIQESSAFNGVGNTTVYFGGDGGIYRAVSYASNTVNNMNNALGITQFYGGAMNDSTGRMVAGAQDNFSQVFGGGPNWTGVIGGDGVFCASDPAFPGYFYAGSQYLNMKRSSDGGVSFPTDITAGVSDRGNPTNGNFVPFIMLDPNESNRMLACQRRLWRSNNVRTGAPPSWTAIKPPIAGGPIGGGKSIPTDHFAPEMPYNLSFCSVAKGNSDVIWASHNNGQVFKSTNGLSGSPSWTRVDLNGPLPLRWVSCITIDNNDANHVYVSYMGWASDNVWETNDGGATFHQVTGIGLRHIPSAPVSALALDPARPGHLLAGTDIGIFTTWDNGATWSVVTQGPGTVPVEFFQWRNNSQLMAYTYGRGAWQGDVNPVDFVAHPTSLSIFRGILLSGGLAEVQASDDGYWNVMVGLVANLDESPVTLDFKTNAPGTVANKITVTCEASVSTPGLTRRLQAFNYDTNAWVEIDSRAASLSDQVVTASITNSVSSFIEPTTREMKVRFLAKAGGIVGSTAWNAKIDHVSWTVSQ